MTAKFRADIRAKYGSDEESRSVMAVAERAAIVVTKTAREMPISTRGVGFNASIAYHAIERTLGADDVSSFCSIHQFYRVMMYAVQRKLTLAYRAQLERTSGVRTFAVVQTSQILEDAMDQLGKIPAVQALLVNAVGRVETPNCVYHAGLPPILGVDSQTQGCFLTLDTLRDFLMGLVAAVNPEFMQMNHVPGLTFSVAGVPENVDMVIPVNPDIAGDVRAFKALFARASAKLPPSFFGEIEWTGSGRSTKLWSSPRVQMRMQSVTQPLLGRQQVRRDARGAVIPHPTGDRRYAITIEGSDYTDYWSIANTMEKEEAYFASALLVGEDVYSATRYQSLGECMVNLCPRNAMSDLVITDRKA